MARSKFVWRCSQPGCPNPNYPKRFKPSNCRSAKGPAAIKCMRHGYKYHYKKVTVPWKGGTRTLLRNSNGYFDCPCGAKPHARRHSQHMRALCERNPHPHPNDVGISRDTDTEDDQSDSDDDSEDGFGGLDDNNASGNGIIEISSSPVRASRRTRRSARSVSSTSTRVDASAGPSGSALTKTGHAQGSRSTSTVTIQKRKRSPARGIPEDTSDTDEDDPEIIALEAELEERREARRRRLRRKLARYDKTGRKH
ncbi:uncharacterized protein SCHCODRAFT_02752413 [Schizophyllum commune H4-8]|nr:uncharacterized protein SCHCODRAFT_02752413 [Schizophyllum commune H4-8]KAI5886798.1 hypothetical protein SCHCODRAFT_02752413 [Schizophyllum commune H4-8]